MPAFFAVLTGDLVGSAELGPGGVDAAMDRLSATACDASWAGLSGPFTRFRGDGWQLLLERADLAPRLALSLQAALRASGRGPETRIGIGLGAVTQEGSRDLSDADGPAFRRAGAALDGMKRGRRLALSPEEAPSSWAAALPLLDAVAQRWTGAQATALLPLLAPDPPMQKDVAERLAIRPQSLSDRLAAAALDEVLESLGILECHRFDQAAKPD
jgi:hypothetical protein